MINKQFKKNPVLLVCVYNRSGNIITHDHLYQLFIPYGQIVKILIFQKAKVWKTFIQFRQPQSAIEALLQLNNKIIFQDGSKMNIFHSKLQHVQFQNDNLGGVNYENLKSLQQLIESPINQKSGIRRRTSTFQDYCSQAHESQSSQFANLYYFDESMIATKLPCCGSGSQSSYSFDESESIKPMCCLENSDSTFTHSKTMNSKKSFGDSYLGGVDDLFRELALQSNEYREWEQSKNRKKSKTILNPYSEQFLIENCPSRVIFVRSIPESYNHQCLYNIFINFGNISRMIFMKDKASALVEYDEIYEAIQAKDEINYVKCDFKIFYSHYESLILRTDCQDELSLDYSKKSIKNCLSNFSINSKKKHFNPPSETLYLTMITRNLQQQLKKRCLEIGCKLKNIEWKQNSNDKWMCLVQFYNINDSLQALGLLQNQTMSNGQKLKLAFTRSKIEGFQNGEINNQIFQNSKESALNQSNQICKQRQVKL